MAGWEKVQLCRPHLIVLCVLIASIALGAQSALFHTSLDFRFKQFPRDASGEIALIAIDSPSIAKFGVWPWPRSVHAKMIDTLSELGVAEIAFDIDFSSPSTPASDLRFAKALEKYGGSVILPAFKQYANSDNGKKSLHISEPLPQFSKHSWPATVNVQAEKNGLVRHYSFGESVGGNFVPSLGALLAGIYESRKKKFMPDYAISPMSVPVFSYSNVLEGNISADQLKGKKIVIGGTAVELGDRFNVPVTGIIAGPMLQVLAAESILQNRMLTKSGNALTIIGLMAIALLMLILWRRSNAGIRVFVLIALAITIESLAILVQLKSPYVFDTSFLMTAIAAYLFAVGMDEIDIRGLLAKIAEKRFQLVAMSLGDGLVCTDNNCLVTFWNPAAESIFGYTQDEIFGRSFESILAVDRRRKGNEKFALKNFSLEQLQSPGGHVLELVGRRKNGETFSLEASISAWLGADGYQYGATLRDISVRKREEKRIRYLAEHDSLTGLVNRGKIRQILNQTINSAEENSSEFALLLIDLDNFKDINDRMGHAYGDKVLCHVADCLRQLIRAGDFVGRLGGDEFAIIVKGKNLLKKTQALSNNIAKRFGKIPIIIDQYQFQVGASIGLALFPKDGQDPEKLLANADLALYQAKGLGKGDHVFYKPEHRHNLEIRQTLESELRRAVENQEFELFYQPQVNLVDEKLIGAEALIRWHHPESGLVSPGEFMPIVNDSTISVPVGQWVLETACKQGYLWQQMGHNIQLGVNLCPSQIQSESFPEKVKEVLNSTGFSPSLLEIEVTENILLEDDEKAIDILSRIQKLGVSIAFDDFGTGYASLTHLKRFPLDRLKIDRTFVRHLGEDLNDAAIVNAMIGLGNKLGLSVIAEGIEDAHIVDLLLELNCSEGQGYYFGHPMPAEEFESKLLQTGDKNQSLTAAAEKMISAA